MAKKTPKKIAWDWCSQYVRLRDAIVYQHKHPGMTFGYVKCCTCSNIKHWRRGDAGHWIDRGSGGMSGVYFDERNIHFQCKPCNGGLYVGKVKPDIKARYDEFMLETYGQGVMDELEWLDKNQSYRFKIIGIGEMYRELYQELLEGLKD